LSVVFSVVAFEGDLAVMDDDHAGGVDVTTYANARATASAA
jgi:hypothetical protein